MIIKYKLINKKKKIKFLFKKNLLLFLKKKKEKKIINITLISKTNAPAIKEAGNMETNIQKKILINVNLIWYFV